MANYKLVDTGLSGRMKVRVEVRKVDSQGRIVLPADWRESEMGGSREVYVIKGRGYLKIIPKRRIDLTEYFDKVDLGVEAVEDWEEFEGKIHEAST
ncbi:MAG: MraZ N-terminal domain-containing protein [Thermofilaceae archaeon]